MLQADSTRIQQVIIADTRQQMGALAAEAVSDKINALLKQQNSVNIIFAAAPSQNEFLQYLLTHNIDWQRVNAFHMDEYVGLDERAPQLFGNFLKDRLFARVSFGSVNYLNGNAEDVEAECNRYSALLQAHPVDIVCMGIGENGHIAFNDPPVANFNDPKMVKIVELEQACRQQQVNDGCFTLPGDVPTHALTLTIPALVSAPNIYCIVPGPLKAQAVFNTFNQPVSEAYPSTILRQHGQCVFFFDMDSAGLINKS